MVARNGRFDQCQDQGMGCEYNGAHGVRRAVDADGM
jgi:hypothetical protein